MGTKISDAHIMGKTVLKSTFFRYRTELYVDVTQEKRVEIAAAAVCEGIKCGKNIIAKIPRPKPLTLCTKPAPIPIKIRNKPCKKSIILTPDAL